MAAETSFEPLSERSHPYTVGMQLVLGSNVELVMDDGDLRVPFTGPYTLRFRRGRTPPHELAVDLTRVDLDLEAFASAGEAERAGRLLTTSLLWTAASKRITIGFRRRTGDYPFAIRDRTQAPGTVLEAHGRVFQKVTPGEIAAIAQHAFEADIDVDQSVLISLEFFAAARLESTPRARFISLMTALEALATQQDYGDKVGALLADLAEQANLHAALQDDERVRSSLVSRLRQLQTESVRQAILRVIRDHVDQEGAARFIDDAYGIRSKMLHEGHHAAELPEWEAGVSRILVQVYSSILGLALAIPTGVEV